MKTKNKKRNDIKPVSCHFISGNHNVKDVDVMVVTQTNESINIRLCREENWIALLKTRLPTGLNLIQ